MNKFLSTSLFLITFLVGFGTGFATSPEYADQMSNKKIAMPELGDADKYIDKRYLNGTIAHHLMAIDLANQALKESHRPEIRDLAQAIISADEKGINDLYAFKQTWYGDNRKVDRFTKINLGTNDGNFDLRFLNALIAHHQEAIEVAKEIQQKSTRNEVLTTASNIESGLTDGIITLKSWRQQWYSL